MITTTTTTTQGCVCVRRADAALRRRKWVNSAHNTKALPATGNSVCVNLDGVRDTGTESETAGSHDTHTRTLVYNYNFATHSSNI